MGQQGHGAVALDRAGAVDDAVGKGALAVAVDAQAAQAVKCAAEVGQRGDTQAHVCAAENQPLIVDQAVGRDDQLAGAAKAAAVAHAVGADGQMTAGADAPGVIQQPADVDLGVGGAGDDGVAARRQMRRAQAEIRVAGELAIAAVGAAQGQVERALAGDAAIVAPIDAVAGKSAGGQQLPRGGLGEAVSVHVEVPGLQHRAVGEVCALQGHQAVADDAAAGFEQVCSGNTQSTGADVEQLTGAVEQAA